MTKLEEIARAIYADRNGSGCKPWGNLPHSHKTPYLRDALAAVKAVREPTEAMVEAAWVGTKNVPPEARMAGELFMSARDLHNEKMKLRYGAMIDAIIAEAQQEGE